MSHVNHLQGDGEIRLQFSTSSFVELQCSCSRSLSIMVSAKRHGGNSCPQVLGTAQNLQTDLSDIGSVCVEWVEAGKRQLALDWVHGGGQVNKILVFAARCVSFKEVDFVIDLYKSSYTSDSLIGSAKLRPLDHLSKDATHGKISLEVTSQEGIKRGQISLSCLLIKPLGDIQPLLSSTSSSWVLDSSKMLLGGHRGMGDYHHKNPRMTASMEENTVASLKQAGRNGADFVEFDVQLTQDLVPVVYHNFTVCVQSTATKKLIKVFVKDMTLSDLRELKLVHVSALGVAKHDVPTVNYQEISECLEKVEKEEREKHVEERVFPTLEEVLSEVPCKLGFNVEVKYPVPEEGNDHYDFPFLDRGVVADVVVRTLLPHAGKRNMFLSSFDADMCTILQLKQSCIPVFYLTTNLCPEFVLAVDPRSNTIQAAVIHAKMQNLKGIVVESYQLLESEGENLVKGIHEQRLVLMTWGSNNNYEENRDTQRSLGVRGIICDRLGEGLKKLE